MRTVVHLSDLQVWIFLSTDTGLPPTVQVVAQGVGRDQAQAVLFGYIFEFYSGRHKYKLHEFKRITRITILYRIRFSHLT